MRTSINISGDWKVQTNWNSIANSIYEKNPSTMLPVETRMLKLMTSSMTPCTFHEKTPYIFSKAQVNARHVVFRELPIFNGVPNDWPAFKAKLKETTRLCGLTPIDSLERISRCHAQMQEYHGNWCLEELSENLLKRSSEGPWYLPIFLVKRV